MTLRSTVSLQARGGTFVVSIMASAAAVAITTLALVIIDSFLVVDHLVVYYGSTLAFLASLASGLLAAYFLFPPKFSLYIAEPVHIAELGFFMLLALIASKAVAVVAHDMSRKKPIG